MNRPEWPSTLAESRAVYESLRAHFLRAIENPDELESALDPLSESDEVRSRPLHRPAPQPPPT